MALPVAFLALSAVLITAANGQVQQPRVCLGMNATNEYSGLEGVVLVWYNHAWNLVNGSDWDLRTAIVTCRELGFRGVADFDSTSISLPLSMGNDSSYLPSIIGSVQCTGNENELEECQLGDSTVISGPHNGPDHLKLQVDNVGMVSCTGFQTVRLVGSSRPHEGRVEVFHNGSWGSVCDDYWGRKDADVVCRQLGYTQALEALQESLFGNGAVSNKIWIDNLSCTGNETDIMLCKRTTWGTHNCLQSEDAGVICKPHTSCNVLPLIGNGTMSKNDAAPQLLVHFKCDDGYVLQGHSTLMCLSSGNWNGSAPFCLSKRIRVCPKKSTLANGIVSHPSTHMTMYECKPGYTLLGPTFTFCTEQGNLNELPPMCFAMQRNSCPTLPKIRNLTASTLETSIGTQVNFTCDRGHLLYGYSAIACIETPDHLAIWNGVPPSCLPNSSLINWSNSITMFGMSSSIQTETTVVYSHTMTTIVIAAVVAGLVFLALTTCMVVAVVVVHKKRRNRRLNQSTVIQEMSIPLVNTSVEECYQ